MPPEARVNYERWLGMGEVSALTERTFRCIPSHSVGTTYADDIYVDATLRDWADYARQRAMLKPNFCCVIFVAATASITPGLSPSMRSFWPLTLDSVAMDVDRRLGKALRRAYRHLATA